MTANVDEVLDYLEETFVANRLGIIELLRPTFVVSFDNVFVFVAIHLGLVRFDRSGFCVWHANIANSVQCLDRGKHLLEDLNVVLERITILATNCAS